MSENRISHLEQDLLTGDFTAPERAALDFARRISQSKPLVDVSELNALRDNGFDDDDIVELTGLIGMHLFLNRMSTFIALPPGQMESLPDK